MLAVEKYVTYHVSTLSMSSSRSVILFSSCLLKSVALQEDVDQKTKKGLTNFNYNLVLGPIMLVAAYKSISWIQDHGFWKKLAAICVKTKRTDIAAYCFGRMQDAYGVQLIEKAENEPVAFNGNCVSMVFQLMF